MKEYIVVLKIKSNKDFSLVEIADWVEQALSQRFKYNDIASAEIENIGISTRDNNEN